MKNKIAMWAVLGALTSLLIGCDRTLSRSESTKVRDDGTVKSTEKTVKENSDGTVTKKEETKKTTP